ncbi:PE-PGRS family protein [Streptomyces sp. NPDC056402]|uniref:PE-PGRS family protein n=1 Tax=Streptomyces sp. NPDC056402 TaxID=3345810 RepID=UPI0035E34F7D
MGTDVRHRDDPWLDRDWGPEAGPRLRQAWFQGLSLNAAAPDRVRIRLLDLGMAPYVLARRDLSSAVLDAAVDHPDRRVRGRLTEWPASRGLSAAQWSRLVLGESSGARRELVLQAAAMAGRGLTREAYRTLAADPFGPVREELAWMLPALPLPLRAALLADPLPRVRAAACEAGWRDLDEGTRAQLMADPDPAVRTAVTLARHEEAPLTAEFYDAEHGAGRLVEGYRLDRDLVLRLCADADPRLRRDLARNPYVDPDLVAVLAADPEGDVRLAVSTRPELTEEQRAAVPVDIDPRTVRRPIAWVVALHEDEEAVRRLAASAHLLLRSSVATARRLPPDVVERLARDEDRVVRLFLAERCDDAPADMLLEVWQWWNGSYSTPDRPYGHPNFPRRDLLRYADHPHPRLRQLALDDPDSTPALVERFSGDGDAEVRLRAATDPRLSPDSVVRLLDDPDGGVRAMAARHPRVPVPVLVALLGDEDAAGAAARNPALPVAVMDLMTATEARHARRDPCERAV